MDLKTFMLLNASRVGPMLAAFENPTTRSSQIMHCLDISHQARTEFPTQKVKYGHLTSARSRCQRGLFVLARPCMGCKVGRMAYTICTTSLHAAGTTQSGLVGEKESHFLVDITQKCCRRFISKVLLNEGLDIWWQPPKTPQDSVEKEKDLRR